MALLFSTGSANRVEYGSPSAVDNLTALTILAWIYPTQIGNPAFIWTKCDAGFSAEKWLFQDDLGYLVWEWQRSTSYASAFGSASPVTINTWNMVGVTWDGSTNPSLWIGNLTNRVEIAEIGAYDSRSPGEGTIADDSGNNISIGTLAPGDTFGFGGRIACVMTFNRVLSLGEMRNLQYRPRPISGTVFYTHLGFPGTTCPEWSGNGHVAGTVTSSTNAAHAPFAPLFDYRGGWQGTAAAAAAANYTLTADAGAYGYQGNATSLPVARQMPAAQGAYPYTGQAAGLPVNRQMAAEAGAYPYDGQAAAFVRAARILAESGAYPYDGQAAGLVKAANLVAEAGNYPYTGQDAGVPVNRHLAAEAGNYPYDGQTAAFVKAVRMAAETGNYPYTGSDATFVTGAVLFANTGTYAYSGQDAGLIVARILLAEAGAYSYNGNAVTLTYNPTSNNYTLVCSAGSYDYQGSAAGMVRAAVMPAAPGAYAYDGNPVGLPVNRHLAADAGSYPYQGFAAAFQKALIMAVTTGNYPYTGNAVTLSIASQNLPTGVPGITSGSGVTGILVTVSGATGISDGTGETGVE